MTATKIPRKPAKKSVTEVYAESAVVGENVRMLIARYRDTQDALAGFIGITGRTLRARLESPWDFRFSELEAIARRYDVTVGQLTRPIRFDG